MRYSSNVLDFGVKFLIWETIKTSKLVSDNKSIMVRLALGSWRQTAHWISCVDNCDLLSQTRAEWSHASIINRLRQCSHMSSNIIVNDEYFWCAIFIVIWCVYVVWNIWDAYGIGNRVAWFATVSKWLSTNQYITLIAPGIKFILGFIITPLCKVIQTYMYME